ncbi:pentapeptide repeat-containing protein [Sphingomonas sp. DT-204]|uniref:pentapeptide repeat-containing protein n=1 Tax=Sphingomonas sp. DT-204 TaxID=3396166 RepID=UPI003F1985F9
MSGLPIIAVLSLAQQQVPPSRAPEPAPITAIGCAAQAGEVDGTGASLPPPIDGTTLKKVSAIRKLRRRAKDGRVSVIDGGDFTGWDFRKAGLSSICFRGSKLGGSDWRGVNAPGMGFIVSDLSNAKLAGAVMPGALFRTTTLAGADATRADFRGGRLDGGWNASLAGWKIDGASFAGFRFQCGVTEADGCPFDRKGISAVGTDFSNAVFQRFSFWGATLTGARFDGADIAVDDLAQLDPATLPTALTVHRGTRRAAIAGQMIPLLARALAAAPAEASDPEAGKPAPAERPTGKALFISDAMPIAISAAADPAWPQVLPVLLRLAPSYLLVDVDRRQRAAVRGVAQSDTGGMCAIDAGPLPPGRGGSFLIAPPPGRRARPGVPAIVVNGDKATIAPEQATAVDSVRVVNCAGIAEFGTMKRVPVHELTFDALWSAAGQPPR